MNLHLAILLLALCKPVIFISDYSEGDSNSFPPKHWQTITHFKRSGKRIPVENYRIKIVPYYSKINSLKELGKSFKGKNVFIDLWATWCPACYDEFKYNHELVTYLNKKNIQLLYVSFDRDTLDKAWRKAIFKQNLIGDHVRATKGLRDDITTLIWGGKDAYSIPHYMLLSDGKIVEKTLSEPHDKTLLYKQIDSLLNLKAK